MYELYYSPQPPWGVFDNTFRRHQVVARQKKLKALWYIMFRLGCDKCIKAIKYCPHITAEDFHTRKTSTKGVFIDPKLPSLMDFSVPSKEIPEPW